MPSYVPNASWANLPSGPKLPSGGQSGEIRSRGVEGQREGEITLKEGTTLRQAIALAQGTNYKAALERGIVFRESAGGKREELRVDIGSVMAGKKEDVPIMANDIVLVPNSRGKTIGGALLRAFGLSTMARLPIP